MEYANHLKEYAPAWSASQVDEEVARIRKAAEARNHNTEVYKFCYSAIDLTTLSCNDSVKSVTEFARKAAETFKGQMTDWEFWNEQDIGFAPESAWDYASALKAAYLGFKAADPALPVAIGGYAMTPIAEYADVVMANGAKDYFDIFNIHAYRPISNYAQIMEDIRNYLKRWSYRVGFRYGTYYQTFEGKTLSQYAVTAGFGMPVRFLGRSSIDFGVEFGQRGNDSPLRIDNRQIGLVRQRYVKFSLGLTLFGEDSWFVRYKYD